MKKQPPLDREQILQTYELHLREVMGLVSKTCRSHGRDVSSFLEEVPIEHATELAKLTPVDLTSYLTVHVFRHTTASTSCRQSGHSLQPPVGGFSLRAFLPTFA